MEKGIRKPMMRPLSDEDRKLVTLEVDGPIAVITNISGAGAMTRPFACN
jgi:hypothetical protein